MFLRETSQLSRNSHEHCNGRCPGCELYIYVYIHIGVGSSVVCSTISGNAKASVRGTDSRMDSRFFVSVLETDHYADRYEHIA